MKLFIAVVLLVLMSSALAGAQGPNRVVVVPLCEDPVPSSPLISLRQAGTNIDAGLPLAPRADLVARCQETQQARLETCQTQACLDQATHALALCDDLPGDLTETQNALGIIMPCNGITPQLSCTVASPCVLGSDLNGDGQIDTCVAGARCAPLAEGSVCDPGVLYDCYLRTTFYPAGIFSPLDTCECNCE